MTDDTMSDAVHAFDDTLWALNAVSVRVLREHIDAVAQEPGHGADEAKTIKAFLDRRDAAVFAEAPPIPGIKQRLRAALARIAAADSGAQAYLDALGE